MRVFEQEFEKAGNNKKRILFALGFEEVEILHGLVANGMKHFPITDDTNQTYARMRNMQKAMSVYLGKSKPRPAKTSDFQCPICPRKLRGDKAVKLHLKDVHPDYKEEVKEE